MPRRTLVFIHHEADEAGPHGAAGLDYDDMYHPDDIDRSKPAGVANVTLEMLADFMDAKAEDRNNGAFCGAHRMLAAMLYHTTGRTTATRLMYELAVLGGLDYASGCGAATHEAAWADLGIDGSGEEWRLPIMRVQCPLCRLAWGVDGGVIAAADRRVKVVVPGGVECPNCSITFYAGETLAQADQDIEHPGGEE